MHHRETAWEVILFVTRPLSSSTLEVTISSHHKTPESWTWRKQTINCCPNTWARLSYRGCNICPLSTQTKEAFCFYSYILSSAKGFLHYTMHPVTSHKTSALIIVLNTSGPCGPVACQYDIIPSHEAEFCFVLLSLIEMINTQYYETKNFCILELEIKGSFTWA